MSDLSTAPSFTPLPPLSSFKKRDWHGRRECGHWLETRTIVRLYYNTFLYAFIVFKLIIILNSKFFPKTFRVMELSNWKPFLCSSNMLVPLSAPNKQETAVITQTMEFTHHEVLSPQHLGSSLFHTAFIPT